MEEVLEYLRKELEKYLEFIKRDNERQIEIQNDIVKLMNKFAGDMEETTKIIVKHDRRRKHGEISDSD